MQAAMLKQMDKATKKSVNTCLLKRFTKNSQVMTDLYGEMMADFIDVKRSLTVN
jgi:hypothetical protein